MKDNIIPCNQQAVYLSLKFKGYSQLTNYEDKKDFDIFWKNTIKTQRQNILKNLITFLENGIEKKNKESNNARTKTFQKLGCKYKVSADAKIKLTA